MLRFTLAISVAFLVVSCDKLGNSSKPETPAAGSAPAVGSPSGGSGASIPAKPALPDLSGAAEKAKVATEEVKKTAETAGAEIKKSADTGVEKGKAVVATAKEEGGKAVEAAKDAVANVTESSLSVEKLKEMITSFKPEQLQGIADKLLAAFQDKQGLVKSLTEQIGKLGLGDVAKSGDLTKQLASAKDLLGGLSGKLQLVVDKLKAGGLDVTKYVSALTGN